MASEANKEKFRKALMGAADKYVKQQGRNTTALNAERDEACAGYARIPSATACEFCVTMGAQNDFYHTEESAGGGVGHGSKDDLYHAYCNCQVAVIFKRRGKLVARDPETGEAVPYDGADIVRRYREAGSPTFAKNRPAEAERRRARRANGEVPRGGSGASRGGTRLSEADFDSAMKLLSGASTREELHAAADRITKGWKAGKHGRNDAQWKRLSAIAKERERELLGKSSFVEGEPTALPGVTKVINPASEFMAKMEDAEFHEMIETRFGCTVTDGFKKLPMEIKQPLMADLEAVYGDFPEARAWLRTIGVADFDDANEAIRCIPIPVGGYQLVFNRKFFVSADSVASRYAASAGKGNQIAGSFWPSTAYHDGFHGVEYALCYVRYGSSASEFYTAWGSSEIATEIIKEAYNRLLKEHPSAGSLKDLILGISEYAGKTDSEAICEAAKDVRVSGSDAKLLSCCIVEVAKERLRGLR